MFPNTIDISAPQGHLQEENSVNGRSPEFGEGSSLETSEPRARDCEVRTWVYTTVQQVYTTLFCSVHIGSQVVGRYFKPYGTVRLTLRCTPLRPQGRNQNSENYRGEAQPARRGCTCGRVQAKIDEVMA